MASTDVLLFLGGVLLTAVTFWRAVMLNREIESFSQRLRHDAASLKELQHRKEAYLRLQSVQRLTESIFDTSAITLRRLYMSVADIPFQFLESIPEICKTIKFVRVTHDVIAESVCCFILGVNRAGGRLAREAIEQRCVGRLESNPESRGEE